MIIWEEKRQGRYFPEALKGMSSPKEGYKTQLEVLALDVAVGEEQAGWKVGLTAKATQEQTGIHERAFGYLLKSGELHSGDVLSFNDLVDPFFENELCVILGAKLQGPHVTIDQARSAIRGVAPAFELVERRGDPLAEYPLALADNSQQKYFITGPITSPLGPEVDLKETNVEIYNDGEMMERAGGHEVMDGAEGSVAWLANKLFEFGRVLEPGDKIMTGSFTKAYPIKPGNRIEARFHPFGSVTFEVN